MKHAVPTYGRRMAVWTNGNVPRGSGRGARALEMKRLLAALELPGVFREVGRRESL